MDTFRCRFCNSKLNQVFLDMGESPLANSFLKKNDLEAQERYFPLKTYVCQQCFLVQLPEHEKPENIFETYAYFSSYSESWLKHVKDFVSMITNRFELNKNSFIIEIGSNDGYLLQYFKSQNIPILGIEPARNVAESALKKGIPTLTKFFGTKLANELNSEGKQADLIIGNNVLAHVPKLNDFIEGLKIILKPNGVITMEFPHLLRLIEENQFDTIYHEHYSYFSLYTIQKIFDYHNLTIFDVEEIPTHGGSLRIYSCHSGYNDLTVSKHVDVLLEKETRFGLSSISGYEDFSEKVKYTKRKLVEFLISAKRSGKKVACYGAPAKGNTLLNYCDINTDLISFTVDRSPHKQGLYLPGTHIPIESPDKIRKTKPDYLLILPWNLKNEIMEQMKFVGEWGGKFVVPIPKLKIYD